jgi:hypothetical protein
MTGQCCTGGTASSRPSLSTTSKAAGTILPGALLALLPKCPLCIAAWLTAVSGVGFSATGAAWVRAMLVMSWIAAVAFAVARIVVLNHSFLAKSGIHHQLKKLARGVDQGRGHGVPL